MRRRRRTVAALLSAGALAAGVAGAPADASGTASAGASAAKAPARMLVTAEEFALMQSRLRLPAGEAIVQLYNRGEDPHDLVARRIGKRARAAGPLLRVEETRSGEVGEAVWKLRRGRYKLWCALPGHREAGMRGQLRVR